MINRTKTKLVKNKTLSFGSSQKILIQSMCDIKTSETKLVIKQIKKCETHGADLMRVSVLDESDALSIKKIKESVNIPIVADIHFDYKLAILAIENGADKIRINPGNIDNKENLIKIIETAKRYDTIIRIGINSGSLEKNIDGKDIPSKIVNSALKWISFFEKNNFYKLVISLKSTNALETYSAYKQFASVSDYPLHIGITESGFDEIGIIRSVAGLSPLLLEGIGNTIRISLTHDPIKEIDTIKRLLHDLNLYPDYPTIISCPTCGRCEVTNTKQIAKKVLHYCVKNKKYLTISIMGCVVNGVGEGKNADIGIAGGKNAFVIFKKGKIIKTVSEETVLKELFNEIDKF